ncbi:hypothetical protein B0H13DRAFT_2522291 [Mycena leptocephala]|nr:hypothetical protein B0H13DRAFT_2522291 [Mycena leptocephala]
MSVLYECGPREEPASENKLDAEEVGDYRNAEHEEYGTRAGDAREGADEGKEMCHGGDEDRDKRHRDGTPYTAPHTSIPLSSSPSPGRERDRGLGNTKSDRDSPASRVLAARHDGIRIVVVMSEDYSTRILFLLHSGDPASGTGRKKSVCAAGKMRTRGRTRKGEIPPLPEHENGQLQYLVSARRRDVWIGSMRRKCMIATRRANFSFKTTKRRKKGKERRGKENGGQHTTSNIPENRIRNKPTVHTARSSTLSTASFSLKPSSSYRSSADGEQCRWGLPRTLTAKRTGGDGT